jgi:hypothetical protein
MAMLELQQRKSLKPTKTWQRKLAQQKSAVAATAQTFYIDIPRDHFIHEIIITVGEHATAPLSGLADDLLDIKLVGNGNKYLKDAFGLAAFFVQVERMNRRKHITGMYHLTFSDPAIPEAKALPAWIFTSLQLILTDNAPAAATYHFINVTVVESAYQGEDLTNWKVMVEKVLKWQKYGANTGWQEYEHERAYKVFSYIYAMDDNAALSDTAFDKAKVVGRNPTGEITVVDEVFILVLQAENKGTIIEAIDTGFAFLQFAEGFPTSDFTNLKTLLNIPTAGTNISVRCMERYIL